MKDKLWDIFLSSGKITDYLNYKKYEDVSYDADSKRSNNS